MSWGWSRHPTTGHTAAWTTSWRCRPTTPTGRRRSHRRSRCSLQPLRTTSTIWVAAVTSRSEVTHSEPTHTRAQTQSNSPTFVNGSYLQIGCIRQKCQKIHWGKGRSSPEPNSFENILLSEEKDGMLFCVKCLILTYSRRKKFLSHLLVIGQIWKALAQIKIYSVY